MGSTAVASSNLEYFREARWNRVGSITNLEKTGNLNFMIKNNRKITVKKIEIFF
jgi:hypothetical protein